MQIDLYVWKDGSRVHAMTREGLAALEVDAVRVTSDGKKVPCRARLDSDDKVAQVFPNGKWESASFRESLTGRDNETAAAYQWVDGKFHPQRYGKSWALTLLSSWTFLDEHSAAVPPSENGWYTLAPDIQDAIAGTVAVWKDSIQFPNSGALLTLKSED